MCVEMWEWSALLVLFFQCDDNVCLRAAQVKITMCLSLTCETVLRRSCSNRHCIASHNESALFFGKLKIFWRTKNTRALWEFKKNGISSGRKDCNEVKVPFTPFRPFDDETRWKKNKICSLLIWNLFWNLFRVNTHKLHRIGNEVYSSQLWINLGLWWTLKRDWVWCILGA